MNQNKPKPTSSNVTGFEMFQQRFKALVAKSPRLVTNTLSNIFTMRLVGNKTHGDMAEIGIAEFVHQFMDGFECEHVGKKMFRAKKHEEDIEIINETDQSRISVSLKAYGDGDLQLSTDKESRMFKKLEACPREMDDAQAIADLLASAEFAALDSANILSLVYREKFLQCNVLVFNFARMKNSVTRVLRVGQACRYDPKTRSLKKAQKRKHPIYVMLGSNSEYLCEVRYGDGEANPLQRGMWTNTIHAAACFDSLTDGWIPYSQNIELVHLFRLALNSTPDGHDKAVRLLQKDIDEVKQCP